MLNGLLSIADLNEKNVSILVLILLLTIDELLRSLQTKRDDLVWLTHREDLLHLLLGDIQRYIFHVDVRVIGGFKVLSNWVKSP